MPFDADAKRLHAICASNSVSMRVLRDLAPRMIGRTLDGCRTSLSANAPLIRSIAIGLPANVDRADRRLNHN